MSWLWAASQQLSFRMASSLRLARLVSHLHAAPCAGDQGVLVEEAEVELDKSNVLLIGHTGTGKTLLASRVLPVPV